MLSHLARALLHGVEPADPAAGALVAALLAFSALAGAWAPLRRAATLEPATALRQGD